MAVETDTLKASPASATAKNSDVPVNVVRMRLLVFCMLAAAFGFEMLARNLADYSVLRQLLSLAALLTMCAPALYLIFRLEDTTFLKWMIALSASCLILSQVLRLERELHFLWHTAPPESFHAWHGAVQTYLLFLGLILMLAALHAALIETVATKRRLLAEHEGLVQEMSERVRAENALQMRVRQQSLLSDLNHYGLASVDLPAFLDRAAHAVVEALDVSHSEIYEYDARASKLQMRAGAGWPTLGVNATLATTPEHDHALRVFASHRPLHLESAPSDPPCILRRNGIKSGIGVRIGREEQPLGVLCAHCTAGSTFSKEDITFLEGVASTIAATLERMRAEDAVRQNERYFRALIDSALDVITVLNEDGTIRFESPSVETMLGYTPQERMGTNAFSYIHDEDRPRILERFAYAIQNPGEAPLVTLRIRHKNGTWRILETTGRSHMHDPFIRGAVVHSRDITERVELEQQLMHAQKMESIGRLAGGVAHDFNNLLTAILGYTELSLMAVGEHPRLSGHLEQIRTASHRASDLTRQLLAFARKQLVEPRLVSVNDTVTSLEKMLQRLIGEDVELRTSLHCTGCALVDPGQFEQVITNLVVNARDAMPRGGRILLETADKLLDEDYARHHSEVKTGRYVMLAVSDTGEGMTSEVRERIFEPFFTTKESGKGTGLGLATCYGIVRQAGGHIWVYSEPGQGATFKIYLPRADGDAETEEMQVNGKIVLGTERILLVEDDPLVRAITVEMLREQGYTVHAAASGAQALELAARHRGEFDLLLTDVVMPGMGGRQVAERLCASHPGMRVLYMSGYTDDAIVHHGVLEEGVAFLSKPFTPSALSHALRKVFDGVG